MCHLVTQTVHKFQNTRTNASILSSCRFAGEMVVQIRDEAGRGFRVGAIAAASPCLMHDPPEAERCCGDRPYAEASAVSRKNHLLDEHYPRLTARQPVAVAQV